MPQLPPPVCLAHQANQILQKVPHRWRRAIGARQVNSGQAVRRVKHARLECTQTQMPPSAMLHPSVHNTATAPARRVQSKLARWEPYRIRVPATASSVHPSSSLSGPRRHLQSHLCGPPEYRLQNTKFKSRWAAETGNWLPMTSRGLRLQQRDSTPMALLNSG